MKKTHILNLFLVAFVVLIMKGCTYKTNYIKKYNDELYTVFGNFSYDYLGEEYDNGYDGLGRHNYKNWEIHFTDLYGKEKNVILVNDEKFDYQIQYIYEQVVQRYLTTELLDEYFNTKCYDENTISGKWLNDDYSTKKYSYDISINFHFDLTDYYDSKERIIKDYSFFNLTNTDINKLIDNGIVSISNIYYRPLDEKVLSELELNEELNYLVELTKNINNIIPIEIAYYGLNENAVNYKGESYINTTKNELNFK